MKMLKQTQNDIVCCFYFTVNDIRRTKKLQFLNSKSNFLIPISLQPDDVNRDLKTIWSDKIQSLKYQRCKALGCKDIGIRKSELAVNMMIWLIENWVFVTNSDSYIFATQSPRFLIFDIKNSVRLNILRLKYKSFLSSVWNHIGIRKIWVCGKNSISLNLRRNTA